MSTNPQDARTIFIAALALNTPAERAAYLDEACRNKPDLRQRIEALLRADEQANDFLETGDTGDGVLEGPGTIIDHYKLLEEIGEGGFGLVFMAEQIEPIRRRVALKIVKPGMDTKQVIVRFEAERQALALMDHPNIAHVFDAGATETGRPYFVMELIHGVPITQYCDDNELTPDERLKLFIPVCEAVQHAHQKGIIHRDLKPSNILVTLHDGKPVSKVIDFGTAKALQQPLTEKTMFTAYGKLIGTPQYMSPEQAEMSGLDVDTRADIYSLGVLLYELLTGTTPFEARQLRAAAFDEMMRMIRQEDPPKPSTRVSTLGERATDVARHRQINPDRLRRSLRGDLDWIIMKALEKNRQRRYATASDFARDLQLHIAGKPILAAPPSLAYRTGKFLRRYWKPVSVAVSIILVVLIGAMTSLMQAVRATKAEHVARTAEIRAMESERETAQRHYNTSMLLAYMNWGNRETLIARDIVDGLYPTMEESDYRGWEWYFMQSLLNQEVHILDNAGSPVNALAWSPDSSRIAGAGADGAIRIWDSLTGELVQHLGELDLKESATTNEIRSLLWSPDGERVYSGMLSGKVIGWDLASEVPVFEVSSAFGGIISAVQDSQGRRMVTGTVNGVIEFLDIATGKPVYQNAMELGPLVGICVSPDDELVFTIFHNQKVVALRLVDGEKIYEESTGVHAWGGAISPNGEHLLLCGNENSTMIIDAHSGETLTLNQRNPDWDVEAIAASPDGKQICVAGDKGEILLWDSALKTIQGIFPSSSKNISRLSYSPDGKWLASASSDGTVSIWNAHRFGDPFIDLQRSNWIGTVRWSPVDDRLLIDEMLPVVPVVDGSTGSVLQEIGNHKSRTTNTSWSMDGSKIVTAGYYEPIKIWDASTGVLLRELEGEFPHTYNTAWSPMSNLVAGIFGRENSILRCGPDDLQLRIWHAGTGELRHTINGDFCGIEDLAWSIDNLIATPWNNGTAIAIYDVDSGDLKTMLSPPGTAVTSAIRSLEWSPDGRYLAAGGTPGVLYVFDLDAERLVYQVAFHTDRIFDIAWSPDGTRIATAGWDCSVKIINAQTGDLVFQIINPSQVWDGERGIWTVDWNHDGTKLAIGSMDYHVRIYDASRGYEEGGRKR